MLETGSIQHVCELHSRTSTRDMLAQEMDNEIYLMKELGTIVNYHGSDDQLCRPMCSTSTNPVGLWQPRPHNSIYYHNFFEYCIETCQMQRAQQRLNSLGRNILHGSWICRFATPESRHLLVCLLLDLLFIMVS